MNNSPIMMMLYSARFHSEAKARAWAKQQLPLVRKIKSRLFVVPSKYDWHVWRTEVEHDLLLLIANSVHGTIRMMSTREWYQCWSEDTSNDYRPWSSFTEIWEVT